MKNSVGHTSVIYIDKESAKALISSGSDIHSMESHQDSNEDIDHEEHNIESFLNEMDQETPQKQITSQRMRVRQFTIDNRAKKKDDRAEIRHPTEHP